MPLRSTLVRLGALALLAVACTADPEPVDQSSPVGIADARPAVGAVGGAEPRPVRPEPAPDGSDDAARRPSVTVEASAPPIPAVDAAIARRRRGTVPKEQLCPLVEPGGCDLLPDLLSPAEVALVEWVATHLDEAETAGVLVETAHAVCEVLDTMSWDELVIRAEHVSRTGSDPEVVEMVRTMPFLAPQATTFLCPEHAAAARQQMTTAVCSELPPDVCAEFEADWLS